MEYYDFNKTWLKKESNDYYKNLLKEIKIKKDNMTTIEHLICLTNEKKNVNCNIYLKNKSMVINLTLLIKYYRTNFTRLALLTKIHFFEGQVM